MTLHAPHTPLFSMLIACGIATATFAATIPVQADDVPAWLVVVKEDATMQVSPKAGPPVTAALLPGEIVKVREAKPEGYLVLREERSGKKTLGLIAKEAVAVPDQGLQWINTQLQKDAARADLLRARALLWDFKGEFDKAIADLTEAIRLKPDYEDAYRTRAAVWDEKNQIDKALADIDHVLQTSRNANNYCWRGNFLAHQGELDKAIEAFTTAIGLDAQFDQAFAERGDAWRTKGDIDKAMADYNAAIGINPGDDGHYARRGFAWQSKNDLDKALADFNTAIRLSPRDNIHYFNRGGVLRDKNEHDKAIADYTTAISLSARNEESAIAYSARGDTWRLDQQYGKAAADYAKAIETNPKDGEPYLRLSSLQVFCPDKQYRDAEKAVANAKKACELIDEKFCLDTLAAAYAAAGDFEQAKKAQAKAIELAPAEAKEFLRSQLKLYEQGKKPLDADIAPAAPPAAPIAPAAPPAPLPAPGT